MLGIAASYLLGVHRQATNATWGGGTGRGRLLCIRVPGRDHLGWSSANARGGELSSVLVPAAGTWFWERGRKLSLNNIGIHEWKKWKWVSFFTLKPRKIPNGNGHFSVENINETKVFPTKKSDRLFPFTFFLLWIDRWGDYQGRFQLEQKPAIFARCHLFKMHRFVLCRTGRESLW